jgi:hypothetical protein
MGDIGSFKKPPVIGVNHPGCGFRTAVCSSHAALVKLLKTRARGFRESLKILNLFATCKLNITFNLNIRMIKKS